MNHENGESLSVEDAPRTASPRILCQTVGTGGQNNPVWEALAFIVRQRRPDVLYQWCSAKTRVETIPKFLTAIGNIDWHMETRYDIAKNEDDAASLTAEYAHVLDGLRREFPKSEIEIDFTSGTKPMSAAAVAAGVMCRIQQMHYATGTRDSTGRVVETTGSASLLAADLVAEHEMQELGILFNAGQFSHVGHLSSALETRSTRDDVRTKLRLLSAIARAYEQWTQFAWKAAYATLRTVISRDQRQLQNDGWPLELLKRQLTLLNICSKTGVQPFSPERCADLLVRAHDAFEHGRYDESSLRAYRLAEYVGQYRFAIATNFPRDRGVNSTKNVPETQVLQMAPSCAKGLRSQRSQVTLGLADCLKVLSEFGDKVYRWAYEQYQGDAAEGDQPKGPLQSRLENRNESWLAHGSTTVTRERAKELLDLVNELVERHLMNPVTDMGGTSHSISEVSIAELVKVATFAKCPWVR